MDSLMDRLEYMSLIARHYRRLVDRHRPETVYLIGVEHGSDHYMLFATQSNLPELLTRLIALRAVGVDERRLAKRIAVARMLCKLHGFDVSE